MCLSAKHRTLYWCPSVVASIVRPRWGQYAVPASPASCALLLLPPLPAVLPPPLLLCCYLPLLLLLLLC